MINALISGDIWLATSLQPHRHSLDSALDLASGAVPVDLFICNLEAPVKSGKIRKDRRAILETAPSLLDSLKIAQHNVLVLANNHSTDFGSEGLLKTIETCKEKGFIVSGAGKNLEEARKPVILNLGARTIALLSYADTTPFVGSVAATNTSPGVAPMNPQLMMEDIARLSTKITDIWLSLHWGEEFIRFPMPEQKQLAKKLAEAGVSAIFGHHPHIPLGSEMINGAEIHYSLGNFIFPDIPLQDNYLLKWDRQSSNSILLNVRYSKKTWQVEKKYFKLDSEGIPHPDNDNTRLKNDKTLSEIITKPDYTIRYRYLYLGERVKYLFKRLVNIPRLVKDLKWRIRKT